MDKAEVEVSHMGTAVNGNHSMPIEDRRLKGSIKYDIIPAGYILPPIVTIVIFFVALPIFSLIIIHTKNKKVQNFIEKVEEDDTLQANIVATTLLCFCGTIYIFALDMRSIAIESTDTLPSYFVAKGVLFWITLVYSFISLFFDILGILLIFGAYLFYACPDNCKCKYKEHCQKVIPLGMILCVGSIFLSLSYHFQYVLVAWTTTPFYASKIALFYGMVILILFITFKYVYNFSTELLKKCCDQCHVPASTNIMNIIFLLIAAIFVIGTIVTITIFFIYFPTNHSIEQSVTALTTIYDGAIVLFGGLLAYKLFFSTSFSITGVLEKAMDQMNLPPSVQFSPVHVTNWNELTNEGKMVEVIKTLIYKETSKSHHDYNHFYMELNEAAAQAINGQENLRNALTPCVNHTLTHVVKFTLTQPQMPEAFRANGVNIAFIAPLVNALSEAVTAAAGTSLSGDGQITTRIKTDTFKLTVALISALIPALTDVVKQNQQHIHPYTILNLRRCTELREGVNGALVDALNHNPSYPTLNNGHLKVIIRGALIPQNPPVVVVEGDEGDNGEGEGVHGGDGNGGGVNEEGGGEGENGEGENGEEGGGGGEDGEEGGDEAENGEEGGGGGEDDEEGGGGGEDGEEGSGGGENGEEGGGGGEDGEEGGGGGEGGEEGSGGGENGEEGGGGEDGEEGSGGGEDGEEGGGGGEDGEEGGGGRENGEEGGDI